MKLDDTLAIAVRTSSRAKKIRLVASIRGIEAIVPESLRSEILQEFIQNKRDWISKMAKYYSSIKERAGHEEGTIYYLGQKYRYHIVRDRFPFAIVSDSLKSITFHVTSIRRYRKEIEKWYMQQTEQIISERLPKASARMGLPYNKVSIKRQKSRWASCSKKHNLNFNLLLTAAPIKVIDYVILHELVHTVELNHSKRFWELVQKADPDFQEHRKWLEDHSPAIRIEGL